MAAGLGARVLLVDGDPWGGGLELALAAEETPGLRWPDLAEARGSIDPVQLADSLPVAGGFSFLSWPATREQPAPVAAAAAPAPASTPSPSPPSPPPVQEDRGPINFSSVVDF